MKTGPKTLMDGFEEIGKAIEVVLCNLALGLIYLALSVWPPFQKRNNRR